jgi:hypothetical protein
VELANTEFDSVTFDVAFDEMDTSAAQVVDVSLATQAYSLLVSVEWDASPTYLANLRTGFRSMSDYLYDVYDGQLRLDTIAIFDDRQHWDSADIQIHASNVEWPRASVLGVKNPRTWAHVRLPRTWWGGELSGRIQSVVEYPLRPDAATNYRTIGHELGHYLMGFYDEYVFPGGGVSCDTLMNYGYMDYHYPGGGVPSSELSWSRQYTDVACRNTEQYVERDTSCWGYFEQRFEQVFNGVTVPIIRPDERSLNGADYFVGPNDDSTGLDYQVSRFMTFVGADVPQYTAPAYLTVFDPVGFGLEKIFVVHLRTSQNRVIVQGLSAPDGKMIALGAEPADTFFCGGAGGVIVVDSSAHRRALAADHFTWYYGLAAASGSGVSRLGNRYAASAVADSVTIQLQAVEGDYPLIVSTSIGAGDVTVVAEFSNTFGSAPTVQHWPDGILGGEDALSQGADAYSASLSSAAADRGSLRFWAVDSLARSYFFDVEYAVAQPDTLDSTGVYEVKARGGDAKVDIDTAAGALERLMLASTSYPVIRTGLPAYALQAGRAHSLATYPLASFAGDGSLNIFYDESDVRDSVAGWNAESSLQIHKWNDAANQWEVIGGYVDTELDLVSAAIDGPGVYAAFTTEEACIIPVTGDLNSTGDIVTSDIIYMVNYVFKAGPSPQPCPAVADVNCDGEVMPSDIIFLVNYVLKGGPPPCDVCALVPGTWTCP